MDWLKKLLGDDLYSKLFHKDNSDVLKAVQDKFNGKHVIVADDKDAYIPKSRFDEVNNKKTEAENLLKAANDSLKNVQAELETLKKGDPGTKTLEDQIKTLTDQINALKTDSQKKDQELALNAKRDLVKAQFRELKINEKYLNTILREFESTNPLEKLEVENGKIKNADTLFKPFQDNYKEMFGEFVVKGNKHQTGEPPEGLYSQAQLDSLSKQDVKDNFKKVQDSLAYLSKTGE